MYDTYVSVNDAAAYLGISVATLRRWSNSGVIVPASITAGGHRRYSMAALTALKQKMTPVQPHEIDYEDQG